MRIHKCLGVVRTKALIASAHLQLPSIFPNLAMGVQILIPDPFSLGFEVDRIGRERYTTIKLREAVRDVAVLRVMFLGGLLPRVCFIGICARIGRRERNGC
jgi:hypothetical protein